MALYQKITITDAGAALMSRILTSGGEHLTFEAIAVGSGEMEVNELPAAYTKLKKEVKRLPIESVERNGGTITVSARLATDTLTADLYHREIGIIANGVLLAYGNTGNKYDYIPSAGNNAAVQKTIRVPLVMGNMQTTFAEMDTTDLVTHAALEARVSTLVEPVVREISTELAESALNDAVRELAQEVAGEAAAGAYAAQVKAEAAAAHALLSENNINSAITEAIGEHGPAILETLATEDSGTAATGWIWFKDSPGVAGDVLCKINNVAVIIPSSGVDFAGTINAAQTFVTATEKELPSYIGTGGGPFVELTANEKGSKGNGIKISINPYAVRSGEFLTGGKNPTEPQQTAAALLEVASNTAAPLNAYRLFANRDDMVKIPNKYDLSNAIFAFEMALNNKELKSIENLNMRSCLNAYGAFYNCPALESIDGAYFALCKDCYYMFAYDTALRTIGSAQFDYAENTQDMFRKCAITSTGSSTFAYARNTSFMFAECKHLENITSMGLKRIIEADGMFTGCILNLASVKHIANNINTVHNGRITIGINATLQGNSELAAALETIRGKGWTVTEEYNTKTA